MPRLTIAIALVATLTASPAMGALLKFYNPGPPAPNVMTAGTDACSGIDVCDFTLTLAGTPGGTLTATGTSGGDRMRVIQDLEPDLGGLGVLNSLSDQSTDNIQPSDVLRLAFQTAIQISELILFSDHEILDFTVRINGTNYAVDDSRLAFATPLTGAVFEFSYVDMQYYVSAITTASTVPEPATGVLALSALGLLGAIARRRRTPTGQGRVTRR